MIKLKPLAILLLLNSALSFAQKRPELLDPAIRYGVLENGMTYYIMHNEEPKERASFYIVHNVGAMLEEDDQDGLAHMLEHMAFNGSTNFQGKGIKNFLERQGVEFGRNINAYTSLDETVYNISNVPTEKPEVMDSCILILHDWSGSLTLSGEEIDAERGVIKEEWRTRNNARRRMQKALAGTTFHQSKYAERDVIGNMEVIEKSPYSAIRSFYKKWYRPDLQAALVIGDFNVDEMEARVKRILSMIPAATNPAERVEYTVKDNEGFLYQYTTDEEAQYVQYSIMTKHDAVKRENKNTTYLKNQLIQSLYSLVINERLSNIQQKPEAPFIGARIGYFNVVRTMDAFVIRGAKPAHIDLIGSMKALLIENERIRRHGVTTTELERAKVNLLKSYEEALKNRDEVSNDRYARNIKDHFLLAEPKPGISYRLEFVKSELPGITMQDVNMLVPSWTRKDNMVVTVQGPTEVDFEYPEKEQIAALLDEVTKAKVEPFVDQVVDAPLIADEPTPGKVASVRELEGIEAKEYILNNGARVVIYPTDKDDNQILFSAYSKGGRSLLQSQDLPTASVVSSLADRSGLGEHSLEDLKKLLVGKRVEIGTGISQHAETLDGSTTPGDFETLLQLIYLTFEAPRFEKESFETIIANMKLSLENASANPQKVFGDSVSISLSGGNLERRPVQSLAFVDKIDFARCEAIYRDRISNAQDFVFAFVGAIDEQIAIPLIEKYIGSISSREGQESWKDDGVRPYSDGFEKIFYKEMEVAKQTNYVHFHGAGNYSRENSVVLSIAKSILQQRYFETIREEEGGSYGVRMFGGFSITPYQNYHLTAYFDCNPDKADKLIEIIHEEFKNLLKNGPSIEDYNKAIEGMKKTREQSLEENTTLIRGIMSSYSTGYNTLLPKNYEDILNGMTVKKFKKILNEIVADRSRLSVIMKPKV